MLIPRTDIFGNDYPVTGDTPRPSVAELLPPSLPVGNGRGKLVNNDDWCGYLQGAYTLRVQWLQSIIDPRRDLDKECGYPYIIAPKQYRFMYDREGIASRVNDIYPDECWAVDPEIYEGEEPQESPFEQDWKALCLSSTVNPYHYLHRVDRLSGIGRYGALLFGLDDGKELSEPVDGIDDQGRPTGKTPPNHKLLYLRAFDELLAPIISFEPGKSNPRRGQPLSYSMMFADVRSGDVGGSTGATSTVAVNREVHWTRVLHVAEERESSEVYAIPRMQTTFNRLCDVRKILGGSAEMFWKGGFPGFSFEMDPNLVSAGITMDTESVRKEFDAYSNGLQRYLAVVGLQTKSLSVQVADPEHTLTAHLNAIAISKGVPLRIFTGSEQAQLASGQDVRTWNRRLTRRNSRYTEPQLLRPFVDRCCMYGVTRMPLGGLGKYEVFWPDVNLLSEVEQSQIADRMTSALMKYVNGGVYQVIPPFEFLTIYLKMPIRQAKMVAKAINKKLTSSPTWPTIIPPLVSANLVRGEAAAEQTSGAKQDVVATPTNGTGGGKGI